MLFTISRALRPKRIIELGTGTGFSTAALAGGWPPAKIITIDNFKEGGIGEKGPMVCKTLWSRLKLDNIELIVSDVKDVEIQWVPADLVFIDGWIKTGVPAGLTKAAKVIVEHDEKNSRPRFKHKAQLNTQCFLSFHSDNEDLVKWASRFLSTFEREMPTPEVEDGPDSSDRDPVRRRPGDKQTD